MFSALLHSFIFAKIKAEIRIIGIYNVCLQIQSIISSREIENNICYLMFAKLNDRLCCSKAQIGRGLTCANHVM